MAIGQTMTELRLLARSRAICGYAAATTVFRAVSECMSILCLVRNKHQMSHVNVRGFVKEYVAHVG
jgi:hypothetical protein